MAKIAVAGKGGVGKTTFSAVLAHALTAAGQTVYAIDADPNPTLGQALGFPEDLLAKLVPIIDMKDLVEERTGARPGESGAYFRLNPRVDDIPSRFSIMHRGVHLLKMGTVRGAGAGCVCPENSLVRALVTHLLLRERETVLLDMVAGLEHLGRGTAASVDVMFIVVEPGQRSLTVAADIAKLARDLGIRSLWAVANKVRNDVDLDFIRAHLDGLPLGGWLPRDEGVVEADMQGAAVYDSSPDLAERVRAIASDAGLIQVAGAR
ncbi:MAG TPA: carbon monoxide dehydrogenase accessory protein CooC [Thermoleophilia bacterium]|nr:carbon monoxide dehydrogenase accessory protein CooC [Thermoleophilia bacterium]